MSGSFNPEVGPAPDFGFLNNDTLVECHIPRIIQRYQAKYDAVLANTQVVNEWNKSEAVNLLFSPDSEGPRTVEKIIDAVESENEAVMIWVFTLRDVTDPQNRTLTGSLLAAKQRGVEVVVATDLNMVGKY